jgi:hypothetical protein
MPLVCHGRSGLLSGFLFAQARLPDLVREGTVFLGRRFVLHVRESF